MSLNSGRVEDVYNIIGVDIRYIFFIITHIRFAGSILLDKRSVEDIDLVIFIGVACRIADIQLR